MSHKTILLVEDEPVTARKESHQLEAKGYRVIHVLAGEEAVQLVCDQKRHVDLILMDIDLGDGIDGTMAAQEILKTNDIPVVFLSSHTEEVVVEKTEKITSYGYVVKNTGITVLDASIKMAFKLHNAHSHIQSSEQSLQAANEELQATIEELEATNEELLTTNERLIEFEEELVKQSEILKESEFFFRESQRAAFIGSYKFDVLKGQWESSEVLDQIFGIDKGHDRSVQGWVGLIHEDDREMMTGYLQEHVIAGRNRFNKEYRIVRKSDGETRWVLGLGELRFSKDGTVISMMGTIQDITDRKRSEVIIQESETKFRGLFNNSGVGMFRTRLDGSELLDLNDRYCEMLGRTREEMIGTPSVNVWADPRERAEMVKVLQTSDQLVDYECRILKKNGQVMDCITSLRLSRDQGILEGSIIDITARKRAEDSLNRLMLEQKAILDTAPVGISHIIDRKQVWVNQKTCELFQYPMEELVGDTTRRLFPTQEAFDRFGQEAYSRVIQGEEYEAVQEFIRRDGKPMLVNVRGKAVDPSDMSKGTIWVLEDITDRKYAEEESRKSFLISENIPVGLHVYHLENPGDDRTLRMVYANPAAGKLTGVPAEDIVGRTIDENFPGLRAQGIPQRYAGVVRTQSPIVFEDIVYGDDRVILATFSVKAFPLPGQHVCVAFDNITDRKRFEEALRKSETRFEKLAEQSRTMIWEVDVHGRYTYINNVVEQVLGYRPDELIGKKHYYDLCPENDRARIKSESARIFREREQFVGFENPMMTRDGRTVWVSTSGIPLSDKEGNISGYWGSDTDITRFKLVENERREAKKYAEDLVQTANAIIIGLDDRGNITLFNDAAEKTTGYSAGELMGRNWFEVLVPRDRYPQVWAEFERLLAEGMPRNFENPILTKSGEERHITWQTNELRQDGHVMGIISFGIDITERKRAERVWAEGENRASVQRNAIAGVIHDYVLAKTDLETALKGITVKLTTVLGIGRASVWELSEDMQELKCIMLHESQNGTFASGSILNARDYPRYFKALHEGVPIASVDARSDHRTSEFAGTYLEPLGITSMMDIGIIVEGRLAGVICCEHAGTMREWRPDEESFVTLMASVIAQLFIDSRRMIAEEKLNEMSMLNQQIIQSAHEGIIVYDRDLRYRVWNPFMESLSGKKGDEVIGRYPGEVFPFLDGAGVMERLGEALEGKVPEPVEFHYDEGGRSGWTLDTSAPLRNSHGEIIGVIATVQDTTARRESEESLRESNDKLTALVSYSPSAIIALNPEGIVTVWNPMAEQIFGWTESEVLGKRLFYFPEGKEVEHQAMREMVLRDGKFLNREVQRKRKDGTIVDVSISAATLHNSRGEAIGIMSVLADITERKMAEKRIGDLLREKELILREVHHRIKNNMNTVIGLLTIQAEMSGNGDVQGILMNAVGRVRSMMVLYDKLYRSEIGGVLPLRSYLPDLLEEIISIFPHRNSVRLKARVAEVSLGSNILSPLGIIINELVTNSMKYAFLGRESGFLGVTVTKRKERVTLVVEDDGPGIPGWVSSGNPDRMGFQIVSTLVEQINGTFRIERGKGAKVVIEFPIQ